MLSLDALVICALLAMPASPAQDPPAPPEPPAQPDPAPDPEPAPEPEPVPEPEPEPSADEPVPDTANQQSEREQQLEEELAEARARATELERMIEELRQQVATLRAELAARPAFPPPAPKPPEAPSPPVPPARDQSAQGQAEEDPSEVPASRPSRSWSEDPSDRRSASDAAPSPAHQPSEPFSATSDADALLASMRSAYTARFPATPNPTQRDTFDAFTADVVKWCASQQRSLRVPVTWTVRLVRVEKGSAKDRTVRFIARSASGTDPRSAGTTFVVRLPRTDADELLKADYRGTTYSVTGTLSPIVRFAPERPYDGIAATQTSFVGPYCEAAVVVDCQSIRPGT